MLNWAINGAPFERHGQSLEGTQFPQVLSPFNRSPKASNIAGFRKGITFMGEETVVRELFWAPLGGIFSITDCWFFQSMIRVVTSMFLHAPVWYIGGVRPEMGAFHSAHFSGLFWLFQSTTVVDCWRFHFCSPFSILRELLEIFVGCWKHQTWWVGSYMHVVVTWCIGLLLLVVSYQLCSGCERTSIVGGLLKFVVPPQLYRWCFPSFWLLIMFLHL